jgi:Domain of unknown function (DUF4365)
MAVRDLIGKRGESIVITRLMDFCGKRFPYFDPHALGEKCPTFDFLVELVNAGRTAPYFRVQTKATKQGSRSGGLQLKVSLTRRDAQRMMACPIPTYLIGVDEPAETAHIVSIHGNLKGSVSSIPTRYPLNCENLERLWNEVKTFWQALDPSARPSVFAL